MALLPTQTPVYPGSTITPANATATTGDTMAPGDKTYAVIRNGSGAGITATVSSFPNTNEWGAALADAQVSIAAGATAFVGPLRGTAHADPVTGLVTVICSAVTTVTISCVSIP